MSVERNHVLLPIMVFVYLLRYLDLIFSEHQSIFVLKTHQI